MLERFQFNGQAIRMEKREDGHIRVCITDMARANGKRVSHWNELRTTKEFIPALESVIGITAMETVQGGQPEKQGTWAIEEVAIDFAGWCSVSFKIWMLDKIKTLMKEGSVSLNPKPSELSRKDILLMALEAEEEKLKFQAEVERQKLIISLKDETIETQQEQLSEWHPLVENYKQFLDCDGLIGMDAAAQMLKSGVIRLYKVLRLYKIIKPNKNVPYQTYAKYIEVRLKTRSHPSSSGEYKQDPVSLFTPKGLNKIVGIMEKKAGSREKLLEYLDKPAKLLATLVEDQEGKRDEALTAIENALPEEEMTLLGHLN